MRRAIVLLFLLLPLPAAAQDPGAGAGLALRWCMACHVFEANPPRGSDSAPSFGSIAADPNGTLAYTKKTLTAKAGTVKIAFTNHSPLSHNLTIQKGTSGATVGATPTFQGATKVLSVKLAPGTYTFFCSVPGHRMAGMVGTLTVK